MNFIDLVNNLLEDTFPRSLGLFGPELAVCATIVVLLLARLVGADRRVPSYWIALAGTLVAFLLSFAQFFYLREGATDSAGFLLRPFINAANSLMALEPGRAQEAVGPFFTGLMVFDEFTVFFRLFLLLFLVLVIALTVLTGIPDNEDGPDFYTLLLGSTVGLLLMVGANHLLILFLGIEMTSVPSYAMVGFLKGRRLSSEASLKYVVYGAGAAGVMLYGTSLLAGLLGTGELPELAARLGTLFGGSEQVGLANGMARTVVLGSMMVLVGIAFKLSLVPFHFWCPDAFEGAAAEVAGFLSVASKAAAFALLVRFVLAMSGPGAENLADVYVGLGIGLGLVAAVSTTFGNLAAYAQTNMKRLLAYSTIAHAGYMLMAVAALMILRNGTPSTPMDTHAEAVASVEGLLYYLVVYLFMNLGAFAIVAIVRNQIFSEEIEDYNGIGLQAPVLSACMVFCLFSLVGIPPFGGFLAKFLIFRSLFYAGYLHWSMWALLAIGGLNTVFSLFYYMRIIKAMYFEPRPEGARVVDVPFNPVGAYVLIVSLPVLLLGFFPYIADPLTQTANRVASVLFP